MERETIIYNGFKFHRYPNGKQESDRKYYRGWVRIDGKLIKTYLHRYMWELANGAIPEGYCVHHTDGDYNNNTLANFSLMRADEHEKLHTELYGECTWKKIKKSLDDNRGKAAEWHSSESGREWHRENGKKFWKDKPMRTFICQVCGKTFESNSQQTPKFCSNNCKSEWRRQSGVDNEERICPICGTKFIVNKYSHKECCSRSCTAKNRRNK